MRSHPERSRRDTYLSIAAVAMAAAYLLGASANVTWYTRGWISFLGNSLLAADWVLQVCGFLLLVVGFAVIAFAFLSGNDVRDTGLRRGALVVAGGYGVIFIGGALSLFYYSRSPHPGWSQSSTTVQVVAYLAALAGALLAASAFDRPQTLTGVIASARNRRLGWASVAFGIEFALLLLSRLVTDSPGWTWDTAYIPAVIAAVVVAVGFFGAARAYRPASHGALARREGIFAVAATLFLLFRVLELTYIRDLASWLSRLESIFFVVAALCATFGFAVSRRSLLGRDSPSATSGVR